ncbi:MAG TPA: phosphoribosylformylglycinamidine synthase subunit PurL [Candidatus Limnocylindrales bacterium]|nr:phosphoribosylformylglycinamidine synthase subunit PurL [Candidatus Limnocylindrales bacterium]
MTSLAVESAGPGEPSEPTERASGEPRHRALGLTDDELAAIVERLGRAPNDLELAMFGVMWSEHCSYKSSRLLLRTLPSGGPGVVAGPGENAGAMDLGGGLAVCFKLESHNHPSAVEPFQGAATGVGGILRDIVAMGARPIAILDALKFGPPDDPQVRHLVRGVVRGVGSYGNCVGVPTVGGELVFEASYRHDPLVNVMAVGLLEQRNLMRAAATRVGDLAVLYGSPTGRDGIGGASVLASATMGGAGGAPGGGASVGSKRPSVQVGDPFAGKLLMEVSLELVAAGLLEGLGDLGAAGLTCAASEMADRGGRGLSIDLDAVPRRAEGMTPDEVMTSESQERMLAIVAPERLAEVQAVCARWGLPAAVVGRVTDDRLLRIVTGGLDEHGEPRPGATVLASLPAAALASEAIVHDRAWRAPVRRRLAPAPGAPQVVHDGLPERGMDPGLVLEALLGGPELGSRAWVSRQYDATVGGDTVCGPQHGAAVLRLKATGQGLVMATDACAAVGALDPYLGAALAVAECSRNVAVTGARPLGLTDGLNLGDPTRPEEAWALREAVRGVADAARGLGLPVVGGNVSLYNEADGRPIAPTTQIGVVGLLDDAARHVEPAFQAVGDIVALLGTVVPGLAGSAYAALAGAAPDDRPPTLDLAREAALQQLLVAAAEEGLLRSAQDVSGGGLAVAIAEAAIWSGLGVSLELPVGSAPAIELFGESPSRAVVSLDPAAWPRLAALARQHGLPLTRLGTVVDSGRILIRLVGEGATGAAEDRGAGVADALDEPLAALRSAWERALPRALGEET